MENKKIKIDKFFDKNYKKICKKLKNYNANNDCIYDVINYAVEVVYNNLDKYYDMLNEQDGENNMMKNITVIVKNSIFSDKSEFRRKYSIGYDYRLDIKTKAIINDDIIYNLYDMNLYENKLDITLDDFIKNELNDISDYNHILYNFIKELEKTEYKLIVINDVNYYLTDLNKNYILFNYYIKRLYKDKEYSIFKMAKDLKINRELLKNSINSMYYIIKMETNKKYNELKKGF